MDNILDKIDFNSLINAANNTMYCDAECQRKKKETQLRERMNAAALMIEKAPENYEKAKKDYIEFIHGANYYNEYKIEEDTQDFREKITPLLKKLGLQYVELRETEKNRKHLSKTNAILKNTEKKTKEQLEKINSKLDTIEKTVNTTKKQEYYENENKNSLMSVYTINNVFFYALVLLSIIVYYMRFKTVSMRFISVVIGVVVYGWVVNYYTVK